MEHYSGWEWPAWPQSCRPRHRQPRYYDWRPYQYVKYRYHKLHVILLTSGRLAISSMVEAAGISFERTKAVGVATWVKIDLRLRSVMVSTPSLFDTDANLLATKSWCTWKSKVVMSFRTTIYLSRDNFARLRGWNWSRKDSWDEANKDEDSREHHEDWSEKSTQGFWKSVG